MAAVPAHDARPASVGHSTAAAAGVVLSTHQPNDITQRRVGEH